MTDFVAPLCFLLAVVAAALSGTVFKPDEWYAHLRKPSWNPPNWVFPIAWSGLYLMIAVAGWIVWEAAPPGDRMVPMTVYGVQLALNATWSAIFFGMKRMDLALAELILLWLSIVATMVVFMPISTLAVWLLVPYLAWVSFAGVLNATVWRLNKEEPLEA